MAKTKLTEEKRGLILKYMIAHFDEANPAKRRDELAVRVVSKINTMLRKKYPEEDMVVLRKYALTSKEHDFRFIQESNRRVFGVSFSVNDANKYELTDSPNVRVFSAKTVFPVSDSFAKLVDDWQDESHRVSEIRRNKIKEYQGFVLCCKTVEDAEEAVKFTPEIRQKLGATSNSVVAVNAETLARIRSDFAEAR